MGSSSRPGARSSQRVAGKPVVFVLVAALLVAAVLLAGCASGATGATTPASTSLAAGTASSTLPTTTGGPVTTAATVPTATTASPATTASAATTVTTAGPVTPTTQRDPAGWVRFASQGISVALPASFKGGAPKSAALTAQLKTMAGGTAWMAGMRGSTEGFDEKWLMGILGASGETGWAPMVLVYRVKLPDYYSLPMYVDILFTETPTADIHVIQMDSVRVVYEVTLPKHGTFPAATVLSVWDYSSDFVYQVSYVSTTATYDQLKDTFTQSAESIKITAAGGTG